MSAISPGGINVVLTSINTMVQWLAGHGLVPTIIVSRRGNEFETAVVSQARSAPELSLLAHSVLDHVRQEAEKLRDPQLQAAARDAIAAFNQHVPALAVPLVNHSSAIFAP